MNLWCPNCGSTQFYYDKQSESNLPGSNDPKDIVIEDHMKCKNKSCNYEFNISWFQYVRENWLRTFNESKFRQFKKKPYTNGRV